MSQDQPKMVAGQMFSPSQAVLVTNLTAVSSMPDRNVPALVTDSKPFSTNDIALTHHLQSGASNKQTLLFK